MRGRCIVKGEATGRVLRLDAPISFWGGVDPATGRIIHPRHPQHGTAVAGRVLAVPATIGSSSSSAIMLELMRVGKAPAALLVKAVDAILVLGVIVGRELGYRTFPVVALPDVDFGAWSPDAVARVEDDAVTIS